MLLSAQALGIALRFRIRAPVWNRRRGADASDRLRRAGQPGLTHCLVELVRRADVLIDAGDGVNHRQRRTRGTGNVGDGRRGPVGPLDADARAEVDAIRHDVVADAEGVAQRGVEIGLEEKAVAVGAQAVLHLHRARRPPRVTDRHARRDLIARKMNRGQCARVRRRHSGLEIGERIERERSQ